MGVVRMAANFAKELVASHALGEMKAEKNEMSIQWPFVLPPRFTSGRHQADMR